MTIRQGSSRVIEKSESVIVQTRSGNPLFNAIALLFAIVGWPLVFAFMILGTLFSLLGAFFQPVGESGQITPPHKSQDSIDSWSEQT